MPQLEVAASFVFFIRLTGLRGAGPGDNLLAQQSFHDFAGLVFGKGIDLHNIARHLVSGQQRLQVIANRFTVEYGAFLKGYIGANSFTAQRIRLAYDRGFYDAGDNRLKTFSGPSRPIS